MQYHIILPSSSISTPASVAILLAATPLVPVSPPTKYDPVMRFIESITVGN